MMPVVSETIVSARKARRERIEKCEEKINFNDSE